MTVAVAIYGINVFYDSPDYDDYCREAEMNWYINNSEQCVAAGGKWTDYVLEQQELQKDIAILHIHAGCNMKQTRKFIQRMCF